MVANSFDSGRTDPDSVDTDPEADISTVVGPVAPTARPGVSSEAANPFDSRRAAEDDDSPVSSEETQEIMRLLDGLQQTIRREEREKHLVTAVASDGREYVQYAGHALPVSRSAGLGPDPVSVRVAPSAEAAAPTVILPLRGRQSALRRTWRVGGLVVLVTMGGVTGFGLWASGTFPSRSGNPSPAPHGGSQETPALPVPVDSVTRREDVTAEAPPKASEAAGSNPPAPFVSVRRPTSAPRASSQLAIEKKGEEGRVKGPMSPTGSAAAPVTSSDDLYRDLEVP